MFPTPHRGLRQVLAAQLPRVAVGIDVGEATLRVAVLKRHRGDVELVGLAAAPVGTGSADASAALVRATVRRACRGVPWLPRRVAISIPAGMVLLRPLQVQADAEPDEIAEAMDRAARVLPVPLAALRLAAAPVVSGPAVSGPVVSGPGPASGLSASAAWLMVAARREAVLQRQRLAVAAGLGRPIVDVDILAAFRSTLSTRDVALAPDVLPILVDVGANAVCAVAWSTATVPVVRVLPVPARCAPAHLAAAIIEAVRGLGTTAPPMPTRLVLTGERALEAGLVEAVEAQGALACRFAQPFGDLATGAPDDPALPVDAAAWPVAMGLARRALV